MDLTARKSSVPDGAVAAKLSEFADAHAALPLPDGAGRYVGQKHGA